MLAGPKKPNSEKQKMLAGNLYRAGDEELIVDRHRAAQLLKEFNDETDPDLRRATLAKLFGRIGANANIMPIFACDYGYNIVAGRNLFMNYNCVLLDCAPIVIGDDVQFGPAVQVYTAHHPLDAAAGEREPRLDRRQCLGRRCRRHLPGRRDRRRRGDRCWQRGHAQRAGRRHRRRKPGARAARGDTAEVTQAPAMA
jgi:hypothetical protein